MDVDFYTKKGKILLRVSPFLSGALTVVSPACALMVTILHIETFLTFHFDPSLILILILILTKLNEFSAIKWWMIGPQNRKDEIAAIFYLAQNNLKKNK